MSTYVIRRIIQAAFVMAALTVVFFMLTHLAPGGPCAGQVQTRIDVARQHACIRQLGLNKPLPQQYWLWISGYLHGNFGYALGGTSVTSLILAALPVTMTLAIVSYILQLMIALPLGVFSALRQYSFFDVIFTFLSYVGLSMPTFWLGLMLIYFLGVKWEFFPFSGITNDTLPIFWTNAWFSALAHNPALIIGDVAKRLVLPSVTLMVVGIAGDSRFMRASMLDVIHQDYIRTAKAKGLKRRTVVFKHSFRNAVLPIITNIALYLPTLVGGFVITETIFNFDGLGHLFITQVESGGYSVVDALLMLSAVAVLGANLLADLTYAWVDPRIRYD